MPPDFPRHLLAPLAEREATMRERIREHLAVGAPTAYAASLGVV